MTAFSPLYIVVNVEDEQVECHPRTKLLRQAGYRVLEAASNEEALRIAEQEGPVLVLLQADSDERFRILADGAPALMWMNGTDGCEFVNREYLRFLGVTDVDVRGYDWAEFVHPDDRKGYVTSYLEAVVARRLFEATFRFRRYDGDYRRMKSVGTPRFGAQGEFLGYIGSTLDVTDILGKTDEHRQSEPEDNPEHTLNDGTRSATTSVPSWWDSRRSSLDRKTVKEYGLAVGVTLIALLGRLAFDPYLGDYLPYVTFFVAVAITTWYGGLGAAFTAVMLGGLLGDWFFVPPRYSVMVAGITQQIGYGTYFMVTLVIVGFGQAWKRAQQRAEVAMNGLRCEMTEHKQAKAALRKSEARLAGILDIAQDAVIAMDERQRITLFNQGAERIFQYTRDEVLGKPVDLLLPARFTRNHTEHFRDFAASPEQARLMNKRREIYGRRKNGNEFPAEASISKFEQDGRITFTTILRDITESKQVEEQLRDSEARYRATFANAAVGIAHVGVDGHWLRFNDAVCSITGYSREELLSKTFTDITYPDDIEADWTYARRLLAGNINTYTMEKRYSRKDGSLVWINLTVSLLRDPAGFPQHFISIIQDITERKKVQAALTDQERLLKSVTGAARVGLTVVDPGYVYRFANEAYGEILGIPKETSIIGRHVYEMVPEAWAQIQPRLDRAFRGERVSYEAILPPRRGEEGQRHYAATYNPHRAQDGLQTVVVVVVDITNHKLAQEALYASQETLRQLATQLEQRVDERTSELVASQQRLRALATELNLAEQRERKRLAEELHDHLQQLLVLGKLKLGQVKLFADAVPPVVMTRIRQTDEVLSDALAYSRTLVTELSPPVLRDAGLSAGLKWLGEHMHKHDITVVVSVPEEDCIKLPHDQVVLLFQSVRELLVNASKHAGTGQAFVTLEQDDQCLRIVVRDEGVGFICAADDRPVGELSSKFGLFSIRERMKALGGSFEIISAPDQGTTATLTLPMAAKS